MLIAIALLLAASLGYTLAGAESPGIISRTPYNNRYNDAAAAREDHLG
ncbi:MAG TPA: hypothetical protein VGG08_04500 [Solirubrobacteraceae bacterium]|jgi:hypothetical protein